MTILNYLWTSLKRFFFVEIFDGIMSYYKSLDIHKYIYIDLSYGILMGPLNSKKSYVCHSLSYVSIIFLGRSSCFLWKKAFTIVNQRNTDFVILSLFNHQQTFKMFLKHWTSYFNDFNNIINIFNLLSFFYIKWSLEELNTKWDSYLHKENQHVN